MSEAMLAKRALVLSGSIQSLRQIDEIVDREEIRIFENVWAKPEDWVKIIRYIRTPKSTVDTSQGG